MRGPVLKGTARRVQGVVACYVPGSISISFQVGDANSLLSGGERGFENANFSPRLGAPHAEPRSVLGYGVGVAFYLLRRAEPVRVHVCRAASLQLCRLDCEVGSVPSCSKSGGVVKRRGPWLCRRRLCGSRCTTLDSATARHAPARVWTRPRDGLVLKTAIHYFFLLHHHPHERL